ncbi:MAG TPA: hypothetical protein VJ453_12565 [Terriglobales bacterium]|jgi:hypothetical protein|nr:hypothetical protein [Terriglobales bacterium]
MFEEDPQVDSEQIPEVETSSPAFRIGVLAVALLAFVTLFGYSIHERNVAGRLAAENSQTAAALNQTRGQIDALNAKLDALAAVRQPVSEPAASPIVHARTAAVRHGKPDPRWKKLQTQLDAQGKAIDETRNGLESTRQDLASTRTELQGSIAKTHDELVVLQRKGERNYYEFDIDKSKQFSHAGPVGVSLRKANTKHEYADLELMVDDLKISKKHLNLYEPAMFYPNEEQRPLELVINRISKNHIHGYISAPKYRDAELTAASANEQALTTAQNATASPQLQARRH